MKKIVLFIVVFVFTIHVTTVSAETFSTYLPGGKNYLNPENFMINDTTLYNLEEIRVKSNQEYTLSFPDRDMLGNDLSVLIEGSDVYIDEFPIDTQCLSVSETVTCTFTTSSNETYLNIMIHSELMGLYYSYYGIDFFQLEEGSVNTDYEMYVSPFIDSTSPEFSGSGAFITSYDSEISITEIIASHIVVLDEIDGDLSDQVMITSNQYTGNEAVVGEYLVELYVEDSSGNGATFNLYILVKDEITPQIIAPDDIYLNVNDENTIFQVISSYISYFDDYDDFPMLSIVLDEYSSNEAVLGSYDVSIEVVDVFGNIAIKNITIHVEDIDSPILNSATIVEVDLSNALTLIDIIEALDIEDNYDEVVNIDVVNDLYSGNEEVVGIYFVDLLLYDTSSNTIEVTLTIRVLDSDSPIISGPTELVVSYTEILSLEEIKQLFSVSDNHDILDYNDISIVDEQYSSNAGVPGTYLIQFEVYDGSGNVGRHELMITVTDDVSPIIYVDRYLVVVEAGSSFGESDMLKLLRLSNEITNQDYEVTILQDEYKGNEDVKGDYIYKVKLQDQDGNEMIREFKITVSEDNDIDYTTSIIYTLIGVSILTGALFYRKYK